MQIMANMNLVEDLIRTVANDIDALNIPFDNFGIDLNKLV